MSPKIAVTGGHFRPDLGSSMGSGAIDTSLGEISVTSSAVVGSDIREGDELIGVVKPARPWQKSGRMLNLLAVRGQLLASARLSFRREDSSVNLQLVSFELRLKMIEDAYARSQRKRKMLAAGGCLTLMIVIIVGASLVAAVGRMSKSSDAHNIPRLIGTDPDAARQLSEEANLKLLLRPSRVGASANSICTQQPMPGKSQWIHVAATMCANKTNLQRFEREVDSSLAVLSRYSGKPPAYFCRASDTGDPQAAVEEVTECIGKLADRLSATWDGILTRMAELNDATFSAGCKSALDAQSGRISSVISLLDDGALAARSYVPDIGDDGMFVAGASIAESTRAFRYLLQWSLAGIRGECR